MSQRRQHYAYRLLVAVGFVCFALFLQMQFVSALLLNAGNVCRNRAEIGHQQLAWVCAERIYGAALDIAPLSATDGPARGLGVLYLSRGDVDEAVAAWRSSPFSTARMEAELIARGQLAEQRQESFESALDQYKLAARVNPESAEAYYRQGMVLLTAGRRDQALQAFREGLSRVSQFPTTSNKEGYGSLLLFAAWVERSTGETDQLTASEIHEAFRVAIENNQFWDERDRWLAHFALAESQYEQGQHTAALSAYNQMLELADESYWAVPIALRQSATLIWAQAEGLSLAARVTSLNEAEARLKRAISLAPDVKWSYRVLGTMYEEVGRTEAAIIQYRQVLELDPADDDIAKTLSRLEAAMQP